MRVEIVNAKTRNILRQVFHEDQTYLIAPRSGDYYIRLTNNSHLRRLAVVSVDGLNVLDGKPASKDGNGYVLDPYQTMDIKGWHRTNREVASFKFTDKKESYSAQMGHGTKNTSVIGVAVFGEKVSINLYSLPQLASSWNRPPWAIDWGYSESSTVYRGGGGAQSSSSILRSSSLSSNQPVSVNYNSVIDLGTGYGQKTKMFTTTTTFTRASDAPVEVITIRYAIKATLKKWGVPFNAPKPVCPDAFPAQKVACEAPEGWSG